jgi:hypothetical protein
MPTTKKEFNLDFPGILFVLKKQKQSQIKQKGYESLTDIYIQLNPSLCEPPYTRPGRMVV